MKFTDWINWIKNNNGIDYDGYYGKQCVDLANHFAEKVLGINNCFGGVEYAYELWSKSSLNKYFTKIGAEEHGEYPQRGDVVIWSIKKNGYAGHIAICVEDADSTGFTVFEQNGAGKHEIRTHKYTSYSTVNGWLRPKNQSNIDKEEKYMYGNAKTTAALNVYCDSGLDNKVGSVSANERVCYLGTGEGHPMICYQTAAGYKVGFVSGNIQKD